MITVTRRRFSRSSGIKFAQGWNICPVCRHILYKYLFGDELKKNLLALIVCQFRSK